MDTPTPEQIAQSQRIWQAQQARDRAERAARRAYLEGLRERLIAEIDTASAALADLNRRTLRDLLRDALAAHPSVSRIALNQYTEYNDDTYVFRVDGFWLDDTYVGADLGHASVYDPFPGWRHDRLPEMPEVAMGTAKEQRDRGNAAYEAHRDDLTALTAAREQMEREAYGSLYDVAMDVAARLRTLAPLGRHFWADGFGYAATVEATREALRITDTYYSAEYGVTDPRRYFGDGGAERVARDSGIPLGSVTSAYASDPARAPHVAVRLARTPDLARVERSLLGLMLVEAETALVVPGVLYNFRFTKTGWGIGAVGIGPFEVPLVWKTLYPEYRDTLVPDEDAWARLAAAAPFTDAHGRAQSFDEATQAVFRTWIQTLLNVRERFGPLRFGAAFPDGVNTPPAAYTL